MFVKIAGLMPSRGWWNLGDTHGFRPHLDDRRTQPGPDLVAFMAGTHTRSVPCVVAPHEYHRHATTEEAMASAMRREQTMEVVDPDGRLWLFNADIIEAATIGQRDFSWRIDTTGPSSEAPEPAATLVMVDRKNRPRFAVVAVERWVPEGEGDEP